uniref:Uncharacterized protein n=1 Tax=Amphimedon queenslandica TaxID=400682 RepID=A0A1X7U3T8_AMPQE
MEVEPEYLSTEIIEGNIDVHPSKNAILIHYSVDARVLSERLETMGADLKQCRKTINIQGLSKSTDIQSLAGFLVSQTPLISSKRLPEIEQLLMYMLNRKLNKPGFQGIAIINIIIITRGKYEP